MTPPRLHWIPRTARDRLEEALGRSRVVVVTGPRQSGKTTLAVDVGRRRKATYISLDDRDVLDAARRDPAGLISGHGTLLIDEFQRAGDDLLRAIKLSVDADPRPGRYLLTGSTRFLAIPTLSESLAGRVEIVDLWPLSQGEIAGSPDRLADRLFGDPSGLRGGRLPAVARADAFRRLCAGGYPAVFGLSEGARRAWYEAYVRTVTQRDVRDFSRAHEIDSLPKLLRLLAARTAQSLNVNDVSRDLGLSRNTVVGYVTLLENVYLAYRLPAWSRNLSARVAKHPKVHLVDSGLAAHLVRASPEGLMRPTSPATGPLLETFVAGEIARQRTWAETAFELFHFREHAGPEVDLVLEAHDGRVAAIEVKAAVSVSGRDFRGLEILRDRVGPAFTNGVVLHLGERILSFGDRLTLLPISALWNL